MGKSLLFKLRLRVPVLIAMLLMAVVQSFGFVKPEAADSVTIKIIDSINQQAYKNYLRWPDSARILTAKALLMAEKIGYQKGLAQAYLNMAHVYWSQAYYPVALYYLNQSLTFIPRRDNTMLADCYGLMGRAYSDMRDYRKALHYIDLSKIASGHSESNLAEAYSRYANIYWLMGDYNRALVNSRKALGLDKKLKDFDELGITYSRFVSDYHGKHDYVRAILYNDSAVRVSFQVHNNRLRAKSYVEYAQIYNELKQYDKAIGYAQKGIALGDSTGVLSAILNAYEAMVDSYNGKKDLPQAMAYQKKFTVVQDSLNRFNQARNLELINDYFSLNKQISEIEHVRELNANNQVRIKQQRVIIIILILSLLTVTVVLWAVWYLYKQKKQLSAELRERHAELSKQKLLTEGHAANLQAANNVKDKLLAVIGHDLRSPFANLRGIIEIFEADYISQEEMHRLLIEMSTIIKGAELTLLNLVEWAGGNLRAMDVKSEEVDLCQLADEMEQTFGHQMRRKNITFKNNFTADCLALADANHIRIVLRNLISNAVKFTYSEGLVQLSASAVGKELVIEVEDTGKGMSDAEQAKLFHMDSHFSQSGTLGEKGTGIGLILCKELVELNGGTLWITSVPGKGSVFSFSLPKL